VFQYILEGIDKVKHRVEVDYNASSDSYAKLRPEGKTDLNHLLERIKEKKRQDIKTNILILSGVLSVGGVVLLILSL